jgi:hypothetical protein
MRLSVLTSPISSGTNTQGVTGDNRTLELWELTSPSTIPENHELLSRTCVVRDLIYLNWWVYQRSFQAGHFFKSPHAGGSMDLSIRQTSRASKPYQPILSLTTFIHSLPPTSTSHHAQRPRRRLSPAASPLWRLADRRLEGAPELPGGPRLRCA